MAWYWPKVSLGAKSRQGGSVFPDPPERYDLNGGGLSENVGLGLGGIGDSSVSGSVGYGWTFSKNGTQGGFSVNAKAAGYANDNFGEGWRALSKWDETAWYRGGNLVPGWKQDDWSKSDFMKSADRNGYGGLIRYGSLLSLNTDTGRVASGFGPIYSGWTHEESFSAVEARGLSYQDEMMGEERQAALANASPVLTGDISDLWAAGAGAMSGVMDAIGWAGNQAAQSYADMGGAASDAATPLANQWSSAIPGLPQRNELPQPNERPQPHDLNLMGSWSDPFVYSLASRQRQLAAVQIAAETAPLDLALADAQWRLRYASKLNYEGAYEEAGHWWNVAAAADYLTKTKAEIPALEQRIDALQKQVSLNRYLFWALGGDDLEMVGPRNHGGGEGCTVGGKGWNGVLDYMIRSDELNGFRPTKTGLQATGDELWIAGAVTGSIFRAAGAAVAIPRAGGTAGSDLYSLNVPDSLLNAATPESIMPPRTAAAVAAERETPQVFRNLFPNDPVDMPMQTFEPAQLSNMAGRRLNYVVTEDGTLVIGRQSRDLGGGHIDLAGGKPVFAAGEVKIINGKIVYIDNSSGHYMPSGTSARNAAIDAFQSNGFDVSGSTYVEKVWDQKRGWIPADGKQ